MTLDLQQNRLAQILPFKKDLSSKSLAQICNQGFRTETCPVTCYYRLGNLGEKRERETESGTPNEHEDSNQLQDSECSIHKKKMKQSREK